MAESGYVFGFAPPQDAYAAIITADHVHMRQAATARSGIVRQFRKGDAVTAIATFGSWTRISSGSDSGWVWSDYISPASAISDQSNNDN